MERILKDIHEVLSLFNMSLRKDIENGEVNTWVIQQIAKTVLEKDKKYSSHITKDESQIFY